jgi:outer membrane receptor protein involved in Fe transport
LGSSALAPANFTSNSRQFTDDFDWIHDRHHLSFGGNWIPNRLTVFNSNLANGLFHFNGVLSSDVLVAFVLGLPNSFQQAGIRGGDHRQKYIGLYATDIVQVNKRLSVELGLHWEPNFPDHDTRQRG